MGTLIGGATSKSPPIDADSWAILDSISGLMQRVTGTNLKAYLKTYFDTLYAAAAGGSETLVTIGALINSATAKTTPVDADMLGLMDSAASNILKKLSWLDLKAAMLAYFTTVTTTWTNKRITLRTGTTTSDATPTINTDNVTTYSITAQAVNITSFTTNLSGTPTTDQILIIKITGTAARAITWGASFEASTVALPTTTVTTNMLIVGFMWNSITSKWTCVAVV
jgi:hypothetical protein